MPIQDSNFPPSLNNKRVVSVELILDVSVPNMHDIPFGRKYYFGLFENETVFMAKQSHEDEFHTKHHDSTLLISSMKDFYRSFDTGHSSYLEITPRTQLPKYLFYNIELIAPWLAEEMDKHLTDELSHILAETLSSIEIRRIEKWREWLDRSMNFGKKMGTTRFGGVGDFF